MQNIFFPAEEITENDLYFLCYMIERIARKLHQRNKYVVNSIPKEEWLRLISLADVLHCETPGKLEDEWIKEYTTMIFHISVVPRNPHNPCNFKYSETYLIFYAPKVAKHAKNNA